MQERQRRPHILRSDERHEAAVRWHTQMSPSKASPRNSSRWLQGGTGCEQCVSASRSSSGRRNQYPPSSGRSSCARHRHRTRQPATVQQGSFWIEEEGAFARGCLAAGRWAQA